jgi:hypothetical protein
MDANIASQSPRFENNSRDSTLRAERHPDCSKRLYKLTHNRITFWRSQHHTATGTLLEERLRDESSH